MITILFAALTGPAYAGADPLVDVPAFQSRLAGYCGPMVADVSDGISEHWTFEDCEADFITESETFQVRFAAIDEMAPAKVPVPDTELQARQTLDIALLEQLGFDAAEFRNVHTAQLASESRTAGRSLGTRYHGTKTFVDRSWDGAVVAGSRIIVTRSSEGDVASISGAWPSVTSSTVVNDLRQDVTPSASEAAAVVGIDPAVVIAVRDVVVVRAADSAGVLKAEVLVEVIYHTEAGIEASRPTAAYIAYDAPVNPWGER